MNQVKNRSAIDAIFNCVIACNHCTSSSLEEENLEMLAKCIKTTIDCAAICSLTASLLARNSEHGKHLLKECIEVCKACADECSKHADHHDNCKACAEACNTCIVDCQSIV
jgi:hypothetical protein